MKGNERHRQILIRKTILNTVGELFEARLKISTLYESRIYLTRFRNLVGNAYETLREISNSPTATLLLCGEDLFSSFFRNSLRSHFSLQSEEDGKLQLALFPNNLKWK